MEQREMILAITLSALMALPQQATKYQWQHEGSPCNEKMTFCWYGDEDVLNPQVIAYGNRWTPQDKEEKPFEWVTGVRCLKEMKVCILARNHKVARGSQTHIDLYQIEEWSSFQIRAILENGLPQGNGCEIDSLLLNRAEGSVSMLSVPGPAASTQACSKIMKPKTVVYKLEIGPPNSKATISGQFHRH
jgi:hypothetical protein